MENKNIILIAIFILVIALACVGAYIFTGNGNINLTNATNITLDNNTTAVQANDTVDVNNTTDANNTVMIDANSTNNNTTDYRVYNPQTDSYVSVIGEGYDDEVDRWYTYDSDGVRYYNTRIN